MMMSASSGMLLLAPAPAHSEDHHHQNIKRPLLMLFIILAVLALLAALLYLEYRKKTKFKGLVKEDRKSDQLGRDYAATNMDHEQALPLDVLGPSYLKDLNHQQEHATHISHANYPAKNNTFDSCKMVTLQEGWPIFNMDQLLRSSAQPLYGVGVFGTAYKVTDPGLPNVMIRHLKEVNISFQEFKSRLGDLAKLNHVNVLPIVAYCFSENEKVLLYEFLGVGNLSDLLHGKDKEGWVPLDWPKRAQIAYDVARGIAYIHGKGRNKGLTHGNIKPSNVVLRGLGSNERACLVDTGLSHLLRACPPSLNVGYRAPEVVTHMNRLFTHKADVYSFGVLLLELLTAKQPFPPDAKEVLDLPRLIHSAIQEEWTAEIFDSSIPLRVQYEEEMVLMLKIAMDCVRVAHRERPSMAKVVGMIKLMREFDDILGSSAYTDISERLDPESV